MSPADEKALLQQGIAAARAGDKASARARFRELTARNFDNELAWLWLASVADTPAHAIACLRRVLQINPSHEKARAALFRVLMEGGIQTARAGDKVSAYASFNEASTLDANSELVWTWMASTAPSPGKALDALRRVLQINPSHDQANRAYRKLVVQRGIDLAQAGDPGARAVLLEASAVDPMNETIWLWLARAVSPEESIEYYERILDINPHHEVARAALEQLRPAPVAAVEEPTEPPSMSDDAAPMLMGPDSLSFDESDIPEITLLDEAADALDSIPQSRHLSGGGRHASDGHAVAPNVDRGDGMVVEQFSRSGNDASATTASQASTKEEFLVYHSGDVSTVWSGPSGQGPNQNAAAPADPHGDDRVSIEIDRSTDDAIELSVEAAGDAGDARIDIDTMRAAPSEAGDAMSSEAGSTGYADVDSYLAASESTYASSELVVAASHAQPQEDKPQAGSPADTRADASATEAVAASEPALDAAASPAPVGEWSGTPQAPPADEPIAWNCPICLSGAPASAVRCPTCGSVVTLVDPDLLLDTDAVDRRHVLQVVARLKNRKVAGGKGKQQFDHHFTLGLAYVNAGRVTEGISHLRTAYDSQKGDPELKAQIDTLERRVAQRAKSGQSAASKTPATSSGTARPGSGAVNGKATKTPEPAVDLPVAPTVEEPSDANGSTTYHGSNGNGSRRTILVVDDSPTIQKVVSVTLEAHGHEVVTASDGMEALAKLRTLKPDLVLLDITMPHMDGYQLCRILRSNELTRSVPIVMLSGKDGLFDKMRGRMAGAASYITKPFAPSALPPLIDKYCKRG